MDRLEKPVATNPRLADPLGGGSLRHGLGGRHDAKDFIVDYILHPI